MDADEEDVAKLNMIDRNEQKMYIAYYFSVEKPFTVSLETVVS